MYRRILVPLDGSAPALEHSFLEPSAVSGLIDGLEAEHKPIQTPSLLVCS
jgi:hypothetical protein